MENDVGREIEEEGRRGDGGIAFPRDYNPCVTGGADNGSPSPLSDTESIQ